jgi:hypothetical protein|tara:strand:+ start:177 stop:344 length:168 start_codon:yes stop_codon:yes gene_type:complete
MEQVAKEIAKNAKYEEIMATILHWLTVNYPDNELIPEIREVLPYHILKKVDENTI